MIDFYGSLDYKRLLGWIRHSKGGDYGCIEVNSETLKNKFVEQLSRDVSANIKEVDFSPFAEKRGYQDSDLIVPTQHYLSLSRFAEKYPDRPILIFTNLQRTVDSMDEEAMDDLVYEINMNRENYINYPALILFIFPTFIMQALLRKAFDFISMMSFHFDFTSMENQMNNGLMEKYASLTDSEHALFGNTIPNLSLKTEYKRQLEDQSLPLIERLQAACGFLKIALYYMHTDNETQQVIDKIKVFLKETDPNTALRQQWCSRTQNLIDTYEAKRTGSNVKRRVTDDIAENIKSTEVCDSGKQTIETAHLLDNQGIQFAQQGQYTSAVKAFSKSLEIKKRILPADSFDILDIADTYYNFGLVYYEQGDYEQAISYYEKALAIREKVLGSNHPYTASIFNNLGMVFYKHGDYEKAVTYYERALNVYEKVLGAEHPDTANIYNNIGIIVFIQGDVEESVIHFEKALAVYEKVFGCEHPNTANVYNNLGKVYSSQGEVEKAVSYYEKALSVYEKVFGCEHPDAANTYNNLGEAYFEQRDCEKAISFFKKALAIREEFLGYDHPDTAETYHNLGLFFDDQRKFDDAEKYQTRAWAIRNKKLGANHPDTIQSEKALAKVREKLKDTSIHSKSQ